MHIPLSVDEALTVGQHAFPHDYRSGPSKLDWDPSKWIIDGLHYLGLVTSVRRARPGDIDEARHYMRQKALGRETTTAEPAEPWNGDEWTVKEAQVYAASNPGRCLIVIDSFIVDATEYLKEHVSQVAEHAHSLT